mmetsp:Transcript_68304/g.163889  ORF Transcript_68304/g.163889 Transcript_68304/m.163889 type:complete len:564 (+) Transcript_68304:164-1855(+)|eukprot:CAMPEP_0178391474 /NCGR_PEP_ID=MMETSP0689_2-20121128/11183_1 /TAXON_ID=160604 /ORGANISM="Amphidinium massartii, Strain CS-259" /LENGTH=563 /DNA_ID=CAMNT_0020012021 /DNA_START=82 /DNA_END=1773 /DNA_ORIENTATION=+
MDDLFNKARKEAIKLKREAKRVADLETPLERNIREATSNENWGCANSILYDIAVAAQDYSERQKIMKKIREFLEEKPNKWRRILKTLTLLDFLLKNGNERTVDDCLGEQYTVRRLERFSYSEEGKDRGAAVREKAKAVAELLGNKDMLKQAREDARSHREKFGGLSANTLEGGAPSRPSASQADSGFRMESSISKSSFDSKFAELKKKKEEENKQRDIRDVRYDRERKKKDEEEEQDRNRGSYDDRDRARDRDDGGRRRRDDDDEDDFNPGGRGSEARRGKYDDDDDDDDFGFNPNGGGSRGGGNADLLDTAEIGGGLLDQGGGGNDDFFNPDAPAAALAPPAAPQSSGLMDLFDPSAAVAAPTPAAAPLDFGAPAPAAPSSTGDFDFGDFVGQSGQQAPPAAAGGLQGVSFNPNSFQPTGMAAPAGMPMMGAPMQAPGPAAAPLSFGGPQPMAPMATPGYTGGNPMGGPMPGLAQPFGAPMPGMGGPAAPAAPQQEVPKDTFLGDVGGLCDFTLEGAPKADASKGAGKGAAAGNPPWMPPPANEPKKSNELDFGNPFAASGF